MSGPERRAKRVRTTLEDPFRPLTHVRSALQVSVRRNELHGMRRPPRRGGAKVVVCRLCDISTDLRVRSPAATVPAGRVDPRTVWGLQWATTKVCTPTLKPTPRFERACRGRALTGGSLCAQVGHGAARR
eukprot:4341657-Prymnesium_polylepis.1